MDRIGRQQSGCLRPADWRWRSIAADNKRGQRLRPMWSPDGRWIAFLRGEGEGRQHELRLVPPLGGPERKLTEIQPRGFLRAVTLAWCPDSSCLVVTDVEGGRASRTPCSLCLPVTGEQRQLTQPQEAGAWPTAIRHVARRQMAGLPSRGRSVHRGTSRGAARGKDMTAMVNRGSSHTETAHCVRSQVDAQRPRSCSPPRARSGNGYRRRSTPERLPFVGEDGRMPPIPSSPAAADGPDYIRAELHRRQHLAHRYDRARRAGSLAAPRRGRLDPTGRHRGACRPTGSDSGFRIGIVPASRRSGRRTSREPTPFNSRHSARTRVFRAGRPMG